MRKLLIFILSAISSYVFAKPTVSTIPNFSYVGEGIYRSGLLTADNMDALSPYGIKTIISMKTNPFEVAEERKYALKHNIAFKHIPIEVVLYTEETKQQFWKVYALMATVERPLLVHCTHGSDRTGIIIAMYRLLNNAWKFPQAVEEMDKFGFNNGLLWFWKNFIFDVSKLKR